MRTGAATTHRHTCARQRGAVRLRSFRSAPTDRHCKKIDVTNLHVRVASRHMIAALAAPFFDNRRINPDLADGPRPTVQHFELDAAALGTQPPIGPPFQNRKADAAKSLRCSLCRVWAESRSEALVGALMAIDRCDHGRVVRSLRPQDHGTIVIQGRIEWA